MLFPPRPTPASPAPAGTVLLVEDEPAIARMLIRLFRDAGIRVLPAGTTREAVSLVERDPASIHLAFVDCHDEPGANQEFCRQVRSLHPHLPVVLAGAKDLPPPENGDVTVGVSRPYLPTELVWQVRQLLGQAAT